MTVTLEGTNSVLGASFSWNPLTTISAGLIIGFATQYATPGTGAASVPVVSDSGSNVYTPAATWNDGGSNGLTISRAPITASLNVSSSIIVTGQNSGSYMDAFAINTVGYTNAPYGANGLDRLSTLTPSISTLSSVAAGDLVVGLAFNNNAVYTYDPAWTNIGQSGGTDAIAQYLIPGAPGIVTWSPTVTTTPRDHHLAIVAFPASIQSTDIQFLYSGSGSGASPQLSTGGAPGGQITTSAQDNVWPDVTVGQAASGITQYSCLYVKNANVSTPWQNVRVWVDGQPAQGTVAVGLDSAVVGATAASSCPGGDNTQAPTGGTPPSFSTPTTKAAGLLIGTVPANSYKAIWLRRVIPPGATTASDSISIRCEGDTT